MEMQPFPLPLIQRGQVRALTVDCAPLPWATELFGVYLERTELTESNFSRNRWI